MFMFKFARNDSIIFIDIVRDVFKSFMFCDSIIIKDDIFMIHYI